MIDLGDDAHLAVTVTDSAVPPQLVDSTIVINITLPDQTVAGPLSPVRDSLGKYHYDYSTTQEGRHTARWTGTNVKFAHTQIFDVEAAADISIVALDDVKKQLRITQASTDDELRSYVLSVSENIEATRGICAIRSFSQRAGGGTKLALRLLNVPVVSLTSITAVYPWQLTVATTDVDTDLDKGLLTQLRGWMWEGPYTVVYKAGRAKIPQSLQQACMLIVQHLWQTRRGMEATPTEDLQSLPGWGFEVPRQAAELLQAVPELAGFA